MKVLLVRPINPDITTIIPNLGLGYLATALRREDHQVAILDCLLKQCQLADFKKYLLKQGSFDVIGFQVFSCDLANTLAMIKVAKKIAKKTIIIVGGPHPSGMPQQTFKYFKPYLDYLFRGEAEIGLPKLLKYLSGQKINLANIPNLGFKRGRKVILNKPYFHANLDDYGLPAWELMDPRRYPPFPHGVFVRNFPSAPIITTRGCPFSCTFCAGSCVSGKKIRYRSLNLVIKEIKLLVENYGVKEIHIEDDNFTWNKKYVLAFCRLIKKNHLRLSFANPNGIRIDSLDGKLLKLMKQTGWYSFALGIESGSNQILKDMKKGINVGQIAKAVRLCHRVGIKITGFFILGYPTETLADLKKTIILSRQLPLDRAYFANFVPYPGSEIFNYLEQNGKITGIDWYRYLLVKCPTEFRQHFKEEEIISWQQKAMLGFYLRPKILFNLLKEIRSLKHLIYVLKRIKLVFN